MKLHDIHELKLDTYILNNITRKWDERGHCVLITRFAFARNQAKKPRFTIHRLRLVLIPLSPLLPLHRYPPPSLLDWRLSFHPSVLPHSARCPAAIPNASASS